MKKELEISAKLSLDSQEFAQGIRRAQEQLSRINLEPNQIAMQRMISGKLEQLGLGPLPGTPAYREYQQAQQKAKTDAQDTLRKLLDTQKEIIKQEKDLNAWKEKNKNNVKDVLVIENELKKLSDKKLENEGKIFQIIKNQTRSYQELIQKAKEAYQIGAAGGGGVRGGMRGIADFLGGLSGPERMGMIGMGISGVAGMLAAGLPFFQDYARRPVDIARMRGEAIGGTTGRMLQQMQSGEFVYESMFEEQRKRAAEAADAVRTRETVVDILKVLGGVGLIAGSALAAPAIGGMSALGAAAPVVGRMVALGIAGAGGGLLFGTERSKAFLTDPERYREIQNVQWAQDLNTAFEAYKQQSPFMKDAVERLRKNTMRDLQTQRLLGLTDKEYFGAEGLLRRATRAGFRDEMAVEAAHQIMAAGGSTAMANQSVFALQAQRGLGLTNATQLFGLLSGTLGGGLPEASKNALIDIFSTAQQIGLDKSKYAEENRKFMQNVAEAVSRGGLISEASAGRLAEQMGAFVTGAPTIRGIEAGRTAFEAYQTGVTQTQGYLGALNIGSLMSNEHFRKIKDPALLEAFASLRPDELDPDNPIVIAAATEAGLTPAEAVKIRSGQQLDDVAIKSLQRDKAIRAGVDEIKRHIIEQIKAGKKLDLTTFKFAKKGAGEVGLGIAASMAKTIDKRLSTAEAIRYAIGLESQKAIEELKEGHPELGSQLDKLRTQVQQETDKKFSDKETGLDLDKIVAASASEAGVSLRTLAKIIDSLADSATRAADRMSRNEELWRSASTVREQVSQEGILQRFFSFDQEAANAATKIQENIVAGRDPYEGLFSLERWAFERVAKRPVHANSPKSNSSTD